MTERLNDHHLTDDAFLGGALQVLQPVSGYRAGVDAVLLAAAAPVGPDAAHRVLDVGAGVGTVGLCLARRCSDAAVVLLERERELARIARDNVRRNRLEDRVTVAEADLDRLSAEALSHAGMDGSFHHVVANPPFHAAGSGTLASERLKAESHAMDDGGLERWMRFLARMAAPGGTATVIHKTEALAELLSELGGRFGALKVLPVHARQDEPAIRVIVQGIKGSRAPLRVLPGFVLHGADGAFTAEADAILRAGAALDVGRWG